MGRCLFVLVLIAVGACATRAPSRARPALAALSRPNQRGGLACRLEPGARLRCGVDTALLEQLGLALPLRAALARVAGGAWLLDARGVLVRFNRRAQPTGAVAAGYTSLVSLASVVCGINADARVSCLVDHHDDGRCDAVAELDAPIELALPVTRFVAAAAHQLCGLTPSHTTLCAPIERPCQRACLRFPDCNAPLRCVDACTDAQSPLSLGARFELAGRASSMPGREATHLHGPVEGGYADARDQR